MEVSSINTQCTAIIFIRLLLSTTNFPEAKLSSTFLSPIFWKYSKTLQQQSKIFKDFFACKFVLAAIQQQSENIQRLFRLQICLSRKSSTTRKYSRTFPPEKLSQPQIINYIPEIFKDFLGNQQQQPAAAINSSNQQQQSTAATSSSNQQQQPAAAINSSN